MGELTKRQAENGKQMSKPLPPRHVQIPRSRLLHDSPKRQARPSKSSPLNTTNASCWLGKWEWQCCVNSAMVSGGLRSRTLTR